MTAPVLRLAASQDRPVPREPTNAMLEAGYAVLAKIYPPKENGGHAIGQYIVWQAMFDAASPRRPDLVARAWRYLFGGRGA